MMKNKEIRARARERLSGNWLKMLLVNLIVIALMGAGGYASTLNEEIIITIVTSVLSVVLVMGQVSLAMNIAQGKRWRADNFFIGAKAYVRTYATSILIGMVALIIEFLLLFLILTNLFAGFVGVGDIYGLSEVVDKLPVEKLNMENIALAVILLIVLIAILIFIDITYSMIFYIILEKKEDIGVIKTLKYSRKLMKGKKFKLIGLHLSFLLWGILSLISLGIGFLFLSSYVNTAKSVFYLELLKDKDELAGEMGLDAHHNVANDVEYRIVEVEDEKDRSCEAIEEKEMYKIDEAVEDELVTNTTSEDIDEIGENKDK